MAEQQLHKGCKDQQERMCCSCHKVQHIPYCIRSLLLAPVYKGKLLLKALRLPDNRATGKQQVLTYLNLKYLHYLQSPSSLYLPSILLLRLRQV